LGLEKIPSFPLGSETEKIPGFPPLTNTGRRRGGEMKHDLHFLAWLIEDYHDGNWKKSGEISGKYAGHTFD